MRIYTANQLKSFYNFIRSPFEIGIHMKFNNFSAGTAERQITSNWCYWPNLNNRITKSLSNFSENKKPSISRHRNEIGAVKVMNCFAFNIYMPRESHCEHGKRTIVSGDNFQVVREHFQVGLSEGTSKLKHRLTHLGIVMLSLWILQYSVVLGQEQHLNRNLAMCVGFSTLQMCTLRVLRALLKRFLIMNI